MGPGDVIKLIIGSIVIIAAAYYATRYISAKSAKRIAGGAIRVRERFSLAKDKMICVIEVNGVAYLVVITGSGATLLDKLDASELESRTSQASPDAIPASLPELIQRAVAHVVSRLKCLFTSESGKKERSNSDFSAAMRRARSDETISTCAHLNDDLQDINTAMGEDGFDEIYGKLQNGMSTERPDGSSGPEDGRDD